MPVTAETVATVVFLCHSFQAHFFVSGFAFSCWTPWRDQRHSSASYYFVSANRESDTKTSPTTSIQCSMESTLLSHFIILLSVHRYYGPYRTGTCFVYFTFEICHQLKCCSAIGLVGVLVKFLRTSLLQRFRMLNLSCLEAGHLGKQVAGTKEAVSSYLIKLSERLPCLSDLTDDPCGRY